MAVGLALDAEVKAKSLVSELRGRLDFLEEEIESHISVRRPRVLSLEGLSPLCTGGCWLPDVKYAAGCEDALGDVGGCPPRVLTWDDILEADPDVLLISPCSASPARTMNELHLLASSKEFWALRCVQTGDVYVLDHSKFSRPGPRLVDGAEMLAVLLRDVNFDVDVTRQWEGEAFKYECDTSNRGGDTLSHCTTELAMRFKPCFGAASSSSHEVISGSMNRCKVIRSTIPGFSLPRDRSAHTVVSVAGDSNGQSGESLIVFGGEASDGSRLSDVWKLWPPSEGWDKVLALGVSGDLLQPPKLGTLPTWEKLQCDKIHGENVPTPRSNHASIVCGDYFLIFGGWGSQNVVPLSHCELLHLDTLCWTHCSTTGGVEPPPRGNPTLGYFEHCESAILFGGWNGKRRFNDTWCLDMIDWNWIKVVSEDGKERPNPRTDHSAVMWKQNADRRKDSMIIFGGNVEGSVGSSSELWALQYDMGEATSGRSAWYWTQLKALGLTPPARTSHAATIIGEGDSAKMVIVGGTDASIGSGESGILRDAWILSLCREKGGSRIQCKWDKLDWNGQGVDRCRHGIVAVSAGSMIAVWGGFDGASTISENAALSLGHIRREGDIDGTCNILPVLSSSDNTTSRHLQERWKAEKPVLLHDLPAEQLSKAKQSKLPGALFKALHRFAVENGRDTYIDPSSGYSVFTQLHLKRKQCCGNGCRHCPYGHVNVPKKANDDADKLQELLDW